jgi:hypothetical protein
MIQGLSDPSVANPDSRTIGDAGIALAAQQMFQHLNNPPQGQKPQGQIGAGLSEPSTGGPSHGKN